MSNPMWEEFSEGIVKVEKGERLSRVFALVGDLFEASCDCAWRDPQELRCLPVGADGVVYMVVAEGTDAGNGRVLVKIGHTTGEPAARVAALQTGCPYRLSIRQVCPGSQTLERELHLTLASRRVQGEWFALTEHEIWQVAYHADCEWPHAELAYCEGCGSIFRRHARSHRCSSCEGWT